MAFPTIFGNRNFPGDLVVKNLPVSAGGDRFDPSVRKIPWMRKWQSTLIFLHAKSPGQRNLVDYSSWGHKESDTLCSE